MIRGHARQRPRCRHIGGTVDGAPWRLRMGGAHEWTRWRGRTDGADEGARPRRRQDGRSGAEAIGFERLWDLLDGAVYHQPKPPAHERGERDDCARHTAHVGEVCAERLGSLA